MSATIGYSVFFFLFRILIILCFISTNVRSDEHAIGSKFRAEQVERKKCQYNLKMLWHVDVGTSPFAAAPLIADIDGGGWPEIAAAPFSETITVLDGTTGKQLTNTQWPLHNLESTFHASPLQYDIDGDGELDILLVSTSGEITFYHHDGLLLSQFSYQLPPVQVLSYWYAQVISVPFDNISTYVSEEGGPDHVGVDVHVYATPVLIDLNRDGVIEELVIPTTHMFVEEEYDLLPAKADKYVVGGISIVNLTALYDHGKKRNTSPISQNFYLELTQVQSAYPAFNLFSPTVVDLDGNGGEMEVILALSTGNIHVFTPSTLKSSGQRAGFPRTHSTVHGQITVSDLDNDGMLEMIAVDTSGNVLCFRDDGSTKWTAETSGSSSPGSRIADTNMDGILDVIVPTNEGDIYVFNGTNGALLPKWPYKSGKRIYANVLLTRFRSTKGPPDIMFVADDGNLYILAGDLTCQTHIMLEESSLVEIMSHDLIPMRKGLEYIVSTRDGSIICLGSMLETPVEEMIEDGPRRSLLFRAWPGATKSPNDFSFTEQKPFVYVRASTRDQTEITGSSFLLDVEIQDQSKDTGKRKYDLAVYYGRHLLVREKFKEPGLYHITVPAWPEPGEGHVTVVLTNQHGQISSDMLSFRFNQTILKDIQWLVLAPFIAMVVILLVSHGFPAKDLLPVTIPLKSK